jgi:hypothetical protein
MKKSDEQYIKEFKIGLDEKDFSQYYGVEISMLMLCKLHGLNRAIM